MDFRFRRMDEPDARAILAWRYEGPYAFYNCDPAEVEASVRTFVEPRNTYYAIRTAEHGLMGFCCFGPEARVPGGDYTGDGVLDVGLGMRPDLTGKGIGPGFVAAILAFAAQELAPSGFRLTVAAFNRRAIRVYEKVGFRVANVFVRDDAQARREWVQMVRER
ncbi:MAG: GNAT family N-acetyltransferase [Chloroflexota bacterium]